MFNYPSNGETLTLETDVSKKSWQKSCANCYCSCVLIKAFKCGLFLGAMKALDSRRTCIHVHSEVICSFILSLFGVSFFKLPIIPVMSVFHWSYCCSHTVSTATFALHFDLF